MQSLNAFEAMLIKSTILRVYTDASIRQSQQGLAQANSPFNGHIELERFILSQLPELPVIPRRNLFSRIFLFHIGHMFFCRMVRSAMIRISINIT
jgi:hypothetical protein